MIRSLQPNTDLPAITGFYTEAADYWLLAEGHLDPAQKAADFFTDCPPGCDPTASHRLGLFRENTLSGLAELSFGFPQPGDAYLGLMLLAPRARNLGLGRIFLAHIEDLARSANAPTLSLAVLDQNPRGRAFWEREGFRATGHSGTDDSQGLGHNLHRLAKAL